MKKDRNDGSPLPRGLSQKMLLRMRLTTLLLCCLFESCFSLPFFCLCGSESFLSGRLYNDCRHSKFCLPDMA